jgi:hypothetical protein
VADLPSIPLKINDLETADDAPLTTALFRKMGSSINFTLDKQFFFQEFLSSGTFTVPTGITRLFLYGCGGGGGGGTSTSVAGFDTGGAGGAGSNPALHVVSVVPATTYTITIGNGGAGGAATISSSGNPGADGGDTTFGSLARFNGGKGGRNLNIAFSQLSSSLPGVTIPFPGSCAGSCPASQGGIGSINTGSSGSPSNLIPSAGQRGILGNGGTPGTGAGSAGGGGGSIGNGGNGANRTVPRSGTGAGGNGGIGAGGGGGCLGGGGTFGPGGNGGPGYLLVIWF